MFNYFTKLIKAILLCILIANIVMYTTFCVMNSIGKDNIVARLFLNAALLTNKAYIFPLQSMPDPNPTLIGMSSVFRDGFFNLGLIFLKNNTLEKEIWWNKIYFKEYVLFIFPKYYADLIRRDFTSLPDQNLLLQKIKDHANILLNDPNPSNPEKTKLISWYLFQYTVHKRSIFISKRKDVSPRFLVVTNKDVQRENLELLRKYIDYSSSAPSNYWVEAAYLHDSVYTILANDFLNSKNYCDADFLNLYKKTQKSLKRHLRSRSVSTSDKIVIARLYFSPHSEDFDNLLKKNCH